MNKSILYKGTLTLLGLAIAFPAFAQGTPAVTTVGATAVTETSAKAPKEVKLDARMTKKIESAKERADREIKRRIESMNSLMSRIKEMKKVNDTDKGTLNTQMQSQIDALNALDSKIQADTDPTVLKEDVKLITESYRIYNLVMPRNKIIAQADRIVTTAEELGTAGAKIETRMLAAKTAGKDTTKLEITLADMKSKVSDAVLQAQNAVAAVVGLVPDQGGKTIMKTNQDALAKARQALKTGIADLKAAQADARLIHKGLKVLGAVTPGATNTTNTNNVAPVKTEERNKTE